jgi:protein O-mannosyl-transferase
LPQVLLSPDEFPPYYRPLTRASFLLDYQLFGMDPRGFHAVNVLIHAGAVLALWALGLRLFGARPPAFLAALLLAVHPVNAEAVNFITGRNNALATLFALLSVVLLVEADRRRSWALSLASGAAFFLGVLAKEPAVLALAVMAAWLTFPRAFGRERRGRFVQLAPHAAAAGAYLVMRYVALGGLVGSAQQSTGSRLGARLLLNAYTIPRSLSLVLYPHDLATFHPIPSTWPLVILVAGWAAIIAAALYALARPAPGSTFGLLWFVLNLLPIANIVAIPSTSLVAERYLYAPAIGLWLMAAEIGRRLAQRVGWRWVALPTAIAGVVLLLSTWQRTRDWHDDLALSTSAVRAEPSSAEAHFNLGVVLKDRGDVRAARDEWDAALRLDPAHARALVQRGTSSAIVGDLRAAEDDLKRAIAIDRDIPIGHFNLARIYELTNRRAEALQEYSEFLSTSRAPREAPLVARARQRVAALEPTAR